MLSNIYGDTNMIKNASATH